MLRSVLLASAAAFAACPAASQTPLPVATIELEEISVTANLTPTPAAAVGSAVTIISREELERKQVRLVSDALRSVPGVSVGRTGGFGGLSQVRIRGGEANHTLVLIDGVEVNDPAGGSEFNFAHLMVQDIERIEVLRGPQSALYGSDAMSGVVNIVTRRGEGPARLTGFIEGGNRGTIAGGASLSGSTDRVDYLVGAGGLRTDGFSSAAEWRGNTEKDGHENIAAHAKFGFQATDNLRFDLVGRGNDYYAEGDDQWYGTPAFDFRYDLGGRQAFGRAQATLDLFDGKWQQIVGASRFNHEYDSFYDIFAPTHYEGDKTRFDYKSNVFINSDRLAHTFTFATDHETDAMKGGFSAFDEDMTQTGIAGEYKLGAWDKFFFTGSLRHDFNDRFDDATTWRVSAAYLIEGTGTKLRSSYGTGVKNPTLFELYGEIPGFDPNPDLKPESARGWDIGVDQTLFDGRLDFGISYFEQRVTDLIGPDGNTVVNEPGTSDIKGVEVSLAARPMDNLTLQASFTWQDPRDSDGVQLIRRPEFLGSFDADYVFADGRASAGFSVVYNGTQADEYGLNYVFLDDFVLVHMRAGYKLTDKAELYGRIENLLDEEYEEVYSYGGTGRLGIVGMRVSF